MSKGINPYMVMKAMMSIGAVNVSENDPSLLPFCTAAAQELDGRLRDKRDCNHHLVLHAAACSAYYMVCLSGFLSGGGVSTFKAGDISLGSKSGEIIQTAAALRDHTLAAASHLLKDQGFFCRSTL